MQSVTLQYPTYTYSEIFSEYFFQEGSNSPPASPEHVLIFVISGKLTVHCKCGTTTVKKGEYIFLRKDTDTTLERKSSNNEPFRSVFMGFNLCFLKKLHPIMDKKKISPYCGNFSVNTIKLPKRPYLESLYISLLPYLLCDFSPMKQVLEIKLMEAVYSLILTDERFYSYLFDFDKPETEECEIKYKTYSTSQPFSCYITQQMYSSYIIMRNHNQVTDIYLDVTYKNAACFLNAFGQGPVFHH